MKTVQNSDAGCDTEYATRIVWRDWSRKIRGMDTNYCTVYFFMCLSFMFCEINEFLKLLVQSMLTCLCI